MFDKRFLLALGLESLGGGLLGSTVFSLRILANLSFGSGFFLAAATTLYRPAGSFATFPGTLQNSVRLILLEGSLDVKRKRNMILGNVVVLRT